MTSVPTRPVDIPPFQAQKLINSASGHLGSHVQFRCAQAFGSEIYVGCSNGELVRYALQADNPDSLEEYTIISRQPVPGDKPIDEIVLLPSLNRALVLSDNQLHFFTIPSLDSLPIKPIRHVVTFAVDDEHLKRPPASSSAAGFQLPVEPVDFCILKRNGIAMYSLKDRLFYIKEIPLPQGTGATLARRSGLSLCIAGKEYYNMIDLEAASLFPVLPICQASDITFPVKPFITVVGPNEFLILSWTGGSTVGIFLTGEGDPVRGTLEWPSHPSSISLDWPYITALMSNNTIEIHSIETQAIVQVIPPPPASPSPPLSSPLSKSPSPTKPAFHQRSGSAASRNTQAEASQRTGLVTSIGGYMVPSTQRSSKMGTVPVKLLRK